MTVIPDYLFYSVYTSQAPKISSVLFDGDNVETIGVRAFFNLTSLKTATIPASVKSIGYGAFAGCTGIANIAYNAAALDVSDVSSLALFSGSGTDGDVKVTIGATVEFIPDCLFKYVTNVREVEFAANGVCASVGAQAFFATSLSSTLTIPDSVTVIGEKAFMNCSQIESLTVGQKVKTVGTNAFAGLSGLRTVTWNATAADDDQNIFSSVGGSPDKLTLNIGRSVTKIPARLFYADASVQPNLQSIQFAGGSSVEIGDYAFAGIKSLMTIAIPAHTTAIGEGAFKDCTGVKTVYYAAELPDFADNSPFENMGASIGFELSVASNVTRIPANIFGSTDANKRTRVGSVKTSGNSALEIGARAFCNCGDMTSVEICKGTTSIGMDAFGNCKIDNVRFDAENCNDFTLDNPCFTDVGTIAFGANVTRVPAYLTYGTAQNVKFETGGACTEIGDGAFYKSVSTTVGLPATVKKIGTYAYYNSRIGHASISRGVEEIGDYAFASCGLLHTLNMETTTNASVKIGDGAFMNCAALGEMDHTVKLSNRLTEIGADAFAGDTAIKDVTLSASLRRIGARAFKGCLASRFKPVFSATDGWTVNGISVPASDLENYPTTRLIDTYAEYEWTRDV